MAAGTAQRGRRADPEVHAAGGCFATGVHYVSGVGPDPGPAGQFGRLLHWLTDGALEFASCGNPYDIVRLPGFEFGIAHPETAYQQALHARFPTQRAAIDRWFAEMSASRHAAYSLLALRGMPPLLAWGLRLWRGAEVRRFSERTLAQALAPIEDARLRAVLGARWGDYGAPPETAPLLEHALVTGAYDAGAFYPVGGPVRFAQTMLPVIEAVGGELRLGADVRQIMVGDGRAAGVVFDQAGQRHTEQTRQVISAMGVADTVDCLDAEVAPAWQETVRAFRPGLSYLALYLGFDGDIAALPRTVHARHAAALRAYARRGDVWDRDDSATAVVTGAQCAHTPTGAAAGGTGRIRCRHPGIVHERNAGGGGAGTLATAAVGRLTVAQLEGPS